VIVLGGVVVEAFRTDRRRTLFATEKCSEALREIARLDEGWRMERSSLRDIAEDAAAAVK
jgi:hypothetical protein